MRCTGGDEEGQIKTRCYLESVVRNVLVEAEDTGPVSWTNVVNSTFIGEQ